VFSMLHKALVIIAKNPGINHRQLAIKLGTSQSYLSVLSKNFDPKLIKMERVEKSKLYSPTPLGLEIAMLLDKAIKLYGGGI